MFKFHYSTIPKVMKSITFIAIIFGGIFNCQAQTQVEIPKKANKIIVSNDSLQQANLNLVIAKLFDNGYEPAEINKEYFTVKTAMRNGGYGTQYYLFIRCKDKEIIITSQLTKEQSLYEASWYGEKGGIFKRIFVKMNDFAMTIGGKISYAIQ